MIKHVTAYTHRGGRPQANPQRGKPDKAVENLADATISRTNDLSN
jgi:hypothetical protein